jgi:hypothetical protein
MWEMMTMIPEPVRAWIYRVELALVPVLVAHGVVNEATAALWLALLSSLVGFGLAVANTSTKPDTDI